MKTIKLLLALGAVAGGYHYWDARQQPEPVAAMENGGFVSVPPIEGAKPNEVLIVAAQNCPREDAQQADQLTRKLSDMGIPVVRTNTLAVTVDPDNEEANRNINSVMNSRTPMVFVNGRAKSNPTLDEVLTEYKGSR